MRNQTFVYMRVSTEKQDMQSQQIGITEYLQKNKIINANVTTDKASGSLSWEKRELKKILTACKEGDLIIVAELSRIGRSTVDVLQFLKIACEKKVLVHSVKNALTFDGSIQSTIFSTVLSLAAEIERDFIRSRTREGLEKAKQQGKQLGRPIGSKSVKKLDRKRDEMLKLNAAGVSKISIARLLGVSRATVERYIKAIN